jgi:hypothetical protein
MVSQHLKRVTASGGLAGDYSMIAVFQKEPSVSVKTEDVRGITALRWICQANSKPVRASSTFLRAVLRSRSSLPSYTAVQALCTFSLRPVVRPHGRASARLRFARSGFPRTRVHYIPPWALSMCRRRIYSSLVFTTARSMSSAQFHLRRPSTDPMSWQMERQYRTSLQSAFRGV